MSDSGVPDTLRPVLAEAAREIGELERRIADLESQLEGIARESDACRSASHRFPESGC